ncbi:De-etiolated protein 1 Det1 [Gracilaria domingensis]|nr:De-etiolated protein 1 Det1 [Gracilaria domingensis]
MTITFYLLEVSTGVVADRFVILDDYVRFASHEGVHFYGDMLCILSMRHQLLHIVKIQETLGKLTEERCIGAMCDRDDYQVIARARGAQNSYVAQRQQRTHSASQQPSLSNQSQNSERDRNVPDPVPAPAPDAEDDDENQPEHNKPKETGLGNGMLKDTFDVRLMRRLLVYVYRRMNSEGNASLFYRHIGQYSLLVMQKAQFLDDGHLLIRLESFNGSEHGTQQQNVLARETCFFVVYCMSITRIINLFENRSIQLLRTIHMYREDFVGDEMEAASLPPVRNSVLDEQDGRERPGANEGSAPRRNGTNERVERSWTDSANRRGTSDRVRRTRLELSRIPVSKQVRMVSPYLGRSLLSYNPERSNVLTARRFAPAKDLGSVKFMSAETGELRFKLATEFSLLDGKAEGERGVTENEDVGLRRRMFLFHPLLPFVMAMEGHRPVNFHVYRHAE